MKSIKFTIGNIYLLIYIYVRVPLFQDFTMQFNNESPRPADELNKTTHACQGLYGNFSTINPNNVAITWIDGGEDQPLLRQYKKSDVLSALNELMNEAQES